MLGVLAVALMLAVPRSEDAAAHAEKPFIGCLAEAVPKQHAEARPTTEEEFKELAKLHPFPSWLKRGGVQNTAVDAVGVAVSADEIEVRPKNQTTTVKYPPHAHLATGAVCHWVSDRGCYLLDDVKKGDWVRLWVGTADKEKGEECFYLSILKRPGEKVPASRKPSDCGPYHLYRQRQNEYDERGEYPPEELELYLKMRLEDAKEGRVRAPLPPKTPRVTFDDFPKQKD
jgi:hypothetical protein